MKTRTEIKFQDELIRTGYHQPMVMLGSCFTDNIGSKLEKYLFNVCLNPFGVIYNPLSIVNALDALMHRSAYTEKDLQFHDELWFSFDHYTKFSDPSPEKALEKINLEFEKAQEMLKIAGTLVITFGTSFVYRLKKTGSVVNNCHKIPSAGFDRKMITPHEIPAAFEPLLAELKAFNPQLKILFTVSPVRHIRDGLVENQLSKATLQLGIHEIIQRHPETCGYFPAYEIMIDDLRDYRYYGNDLLHPNEQAIDYIWHHFKENCLDSEAQMIIQKLDPVIKSLQHIPLHTDTEKYRKFKSKLESKIRKLKIDYPFLFWEEITKYMNQ